MNKRGSVIYIVDDDVSVCRSLKILLKSYGFRVETFTRAADFLAFKHPKAPACLVLDVQMPEINGLALQEAMTVRKLVIPIVFITAHGDIPMSVKGMKGGAVDFLPKPFMKKKLLEAIRQALSVSIVQNKEQSEISMIKRRVTKLSPRELEVFRLVAKGMLSKQIAYKRGTALQTIKVHRGRVMQKMKAGTVTELIHFAKIAGITST